MSVYGSVEGKVTIGARISGGTKGIIRGDLNAGSVTLVSGKGEVDSKAGTTGNIDYILKDGKYERSFGAGGDSAGGLNGGFSDVVNKGKIEEKNIEGG